jgi:hypothetical protein
MMGGMAISDKGSRRARRLGTLAALAGLSVPLLGLTPSSAGAASSFSSQSAARIMAAARSAMKRAGSVVASGSGEVSITGVGNAHISELNYSGPKSGTEISSFTSTNKKAALPSGSATLVNGALYVYANQAFWATDPHVTTKQAAALAYRWIEIPKNGALYSNEAADLTMSTLIVDLFTAKSYHKGKVQTVDGTKAITISYKTTGVDAGSTTAVIPIGGSHLPLSVSETGIPFRLTSWGQRKTVSAPKGAVVFESLVP